MSILPYIHALKGSTGTAEPQPPANIAKVVVIDGQSNANGQASRTGLGAAYTGPFTNVKIWYRGVNKGHSDLVSLGSWQDLQDGVNQNMENLTLYMGPQLPLAKRWGELYPGETLYIINTPKGATGYRLEINANDWNSGNPSLGWVTSYIHIQPALQALIDQGLEPYILARITHQGEADAFNQNPNYKTDWENTHAQFKTEWGTPNLNHIFGSIIAPVSSHPNADIVRGIHQTLASESALNHLIDLSGQSSIGDNIHIDQAGQIFFGEAIADQLFTIGGFGEQYNPNLPDFNFVINSTYNFNGDTIDQVPANSTEWVGTWEVKNHVSLGQSVEAQTGVTTPNVGGDLATLRLDQVPLTQRNIEVRWKMRFDTTSISRVGLLLRANQGTTSPTGYLFQINANNNFVSLGELRDGAATFIYTNFSRTINANTDYWFRFRIENARLIAWVSDNGTAWTKIITESKGSYETGGLALVVGLSGTVVQGVFFDDIEIDLL